MTIKDVTRRDFLQIAAPASFGLTALLSSGCNSLTESSSMTQALTTPSMIAAKSSHTFSILQVTDIHFFADTPEKDQQTVRDLRNLIKHWNPDMLIATGDLWHNNPDGRGQEFCEWSAARLSELGIPWTFAWGNHDRLDDVAQGHTIFEQSPNSLYSRGDGFGNYRIEIQNKRSNEPLWQLYVMNSGRDGLADRERQWIQSETDQIKNVPGIAFCHIPVYQYKTIWDEKRANGIKFEDVCFEKDQGAALEAIAKTGRVQAMFVGHDHVNDYAGTETEVELVYGRATGYGGYGGDKVEKGAKLIELDLKKKTYSFLSVFADGRTWQPDSTT